MGQGKRDIFSNICWNPESIELWGGEPPPHTHTYTHKNTHVQVNTCLGTHICWYAYYGCTHTWVCTTCTGDCAHTQSFPLTFWPTISGLWALRTRWQYQDIRVEPGHRVCRLPICIRLTPALLSFSTIHLSSHRTVYLTLSYGWSGVREDWPMHEFLHIKFYIPLLVRKHQESTVGRHRPSFWRYNFITASVIGDTSAQFHKCFVIEWLVIKLLWRWSHRRVQDLLSFS